MVFGVWNIYLIKDVHVLDFRGRNDVKIVQKAAYFIGPLALQPTVALLQESPRGQSPFHKRRTEALREHKMRLGPVCSTALRTSSKTTCNQPYVCPAGHEHTQCNHEANAAHFVADARSPTARGNDSLPDDWIVRTQFPGRDTEGAQLRNIDIFDDKCVDATITELQSYCSSATCEHFKVHTATQQKWMVLYLRANHTFFRNKLFIGIACTAKQYSCHEQSDNPVWTTQLLCTTVSIAQDIQRQHSFAAHFCITICFLGPKHWCHVINRPPAIAEVYKHHRFSRCPCQLLEGLFLSKMAPHLRYHNSSVVHRLPGFGTFPPTGTWMAPHHPLSLESSSVSYHPTRSNVFPSVKTKCSCYHSDASIQLPYW